MLWFLRVVRHTIRRMSAREVENFIAEHSFSDIDKRIIRYIALGYTTTTILALVNLSRQELYKKHYEVIAKEIDGFGR